MLAPLLHARLKERFNEDYVRNPRVCEGVQGMSSRRGSLTVEAFTQELGAETKDAADAAVLWGRDGVERAQRFGDLTPLARSRRNARVNAVPSPNTLAPSSAFALNSPKARSFLARCCPETLRHRAAPVPFATTTSSITTVRLRLLLSYGLRRARGVAVFTLEGANPSRFRSPAGPRARDLDGPRMVWKARSRIFVRILPSRSASSAAPARMFRERATLCISRWDRSEN